MKSSNLDEDDNDEEIDEEEENCFQEKSFDMPLSSTISYVQRPPKGFQTRKSSFNLKIKITTILTFFFQHLSIIQLLLVEEIIQLLLIYLLLMFVVEIVWNFDFHINFFTRSLSS